MIHSMPSHQEYSSFSTHLNSKRNIVFFDSVCLMCNATVQFLWQNDKRRQLYFAPLQGKTFTLYFGSKLDDLRNSLDSILFLEAATNTDTKYYIRSTAIIHILNSIGGFWKIFARMLTFVPKPLRDWGYDFIANHRYQWLGKRDDLCFLPDEQEAKRFLD